jgi:hypothetical protein
MSWTDLDEVVGGLPDSATKHYPQWWHGDRPNTRAWRNAGYTLETVDLTRSVTFRRTREVPTKHGNPRPAMSQRSARKLVPAVVPGNDLALLAEIDTKHALIVLPCSAHKAEGDNSCQAGTVTPWPESLRQARDRLRTAARVDDRRLMPAWRRYTGSFYAEAGSALADAVAQRAHIVILSGGYGVLRAEEPIGTYNKVLRLSDWPSRLLDNILADEAARVGARSIVAFAGATTDYARLVRRAPWGRTGVVDTLLVTLGDVGGGAMVKVPRGLGQAFRAFWEHRPDNYPFGVVVIRLS